MATSAASERVFSMALHVVNSRIAKIKSSSVNNTLSFNSAFKAKNEALKVDQNVSHLLLYSVLLGLLFVLKWTTEQIATSDEARCMRVCGFPARSGRCRCWSETVRVEQTWIRSLRVRGGDGLNFAGRERANIFNPRRTLNGFCTSSQ